MSHPCLTSADLPLPSQVDTVSFFLLLSVLHHSVYLSSESRLLNKLVPPVFSILNSSLSSGTEFSYETDARHALKFGFTLRLLCTEYWCPCKTQSYVRRVSRAVRQEPPTPLGEGCPLTDTQPSQPTLASHAAAPSLSQSVVLTAGHCGGLVPSPVKDSNYRNVSLLRKCQLLTCICVEKS